MVPSNTLMIYAQGRTTSSSPINTQGLEKYQFILPHSILLETTKKPHHQKNIFPLFFLPFYFFHTYKPFAKIVQSTPYKPHPDFSNVNIVTILINANSHSSITKIRKLT